ncbi:ABC transporter permease [Gordonia caeni]|uniref:ABC transporter permease n=1 Tax=Gordonia caeni TaxID=1007097 RepID=A0ABP7PQG1_9ACTN
MSTAVVEKTAAASSPTAVALHYLRRYWALGLASAVVLVALSWAVLPGVFTAYDPLAVNQAQRLLPPSGEHWFGTDLLGRDLYSRVVYGARASLAGAFLAVAVAVVVGSALGALAGWFGGVVDHVVMRAVDVVLSIPSFLLAISVVVLYSAKTGTSGLVPAAIAVGLTASAKFARLIRSEVLKVRASNYVEAAVTSGSSTSAILRRHVIPNALGPTISLAAVEVGLAIIWIASLSFLGLGAQPPDPEWGLLVADGRKYIATRDWLTVYPALTIVAVVLSVNYLARHLRKRNEL